MQVVLNGLAALKPKTGVGHYVAHLHRHLLSQNPESRFDLYPGGWLARRIERFEPLTRSPGGTPSRPPPAWRRMLQGGLHAAKQTAKWAAQIHFAGRCRHRAYDLYHEPNFIPFPVDRPTVVTVHDLSVLLHPAWHPIDRVRHHEQSFAAAVRQAEHVIVVSEHVRGELLREIGLPAHRVTAVHNGVAAEFRRLPPDEVEACRLRLDLPRRFVLCVGTIEPRKNLLTVLRAFADLPAGVRTNCPLVLAGPWGWRSEHEREFFDNTARPAGARHLGYVAAADLPALYNAAAALLYPSYYEGFGLPPIEMLACGGAVACAREADAVREVVGSFCEYIAVDDVAGWRDAIQRYADGECLIPGGIEHAARFTWDKTARETFSVYQSVLGRPVVQSIAA